MENLIKRLNERKEAVDSLIEANKDSLTTNEAYNIDSYIDFGVAMLNDILDSGLTHDVEDAQKFTGCDQPAKIVAFVCDDNSSIIAIDFDGAYTHGDYLKKTIFIDIEPDGLVVRADLDSNRSERDVHSNETIVTNSIRTSDGRFVEFKDKQTYSFDKTEKVYDNFLPLPEEFVELMGTVVSIENPDKKISFEKPEQFKIDSQPSSN